MKKLLFSVAAACMSFSAMAQHTVTPQLEKLDTRTATMAGSNAFMAPMTSLWKDPVTYFKKDCLFDARDGEANAYAFMIFDYRYKTNSLVHFTTNTARDYAMMADYMQIPAESIGFFCSTFVGDKIFAYAYNYYGPGAFVPVSFGYIDPKTGIYDQKFKLPSGSSTILSDMSYDPVTKLIYANEILYEYNPDTQVNKCVGTQIYTIDPHSENPVLKPVAKTDLELFTLAADKGYVYGIAPIMGLDNVTTKNSYLVRMSADDLKKGKMNIEEINKEVGLGVKIGWAQTMEFDKVNHRLWWFAQATDDKSYFTEIDVETGKTLNKSTFTYTAQAVALAMPSQDVNATAPSYVRDLKAKAAEQGEGKVSFSWTNPDADFYLNELKSLKSIKIIRDDEVVATIDASGIGKPQTYDDKDVPSGLHIYKIQTVNENGDGVYRDVKVFVGHDVPAAVSGVRVKTDGCKATITWSAPSIGVNGGWIDRTTIKYDVVRMPDNVKVASDITECKVCDEVSKTEGYIYEVTAKNADGTGATAKSEVTVFGPSQAVPFFTKLDTETEFNKWSVIDNNRDLFTWKFDKLYKAPASDRAVGVSDDYLISPEIAFEKGKKYQVRFTYWTTNWVDENRNPIMQKMEVCYAQDPTAESLKKGAILDLGEFHTSSNTFLYAKQVFTADAEKGHIAFHDYSDPDRGSAFIHDVCVREYSKTDLSITDLKGSMTVVQDNKESFGVEVMNEGSARVENYTVDLIDADGNVLASAKGIAVEPEQKQMVTVEWIPENVGKAQVTARVNLEGDTYPADNTYGKLMDVTVSPAGSDLWFTVNTDDHYFDELNNGFSMGMMLPFDFSRAYSMSQIIFLDKEMAKKNISITGVQFVFDGKADGEYTKKISISAMGTDKDYFGWNSEELIVESIDTEDENWMKLYDGEVTFGGKEEGQRMIIKLTTPYYYESGNLCFMFEKLWDDNYFEKGKGAPIFYYHNIYDDGEPFNNRTCKCSSNYSEYADPDRIGTMFYVPFTMLAYTDGDINGIIGISQNGLNFDFSEDKLRMTQICDTITVYDMAGRVVAEGKYTDTLNVSGKGIYVIKATAGDKHISTKVSVN